MVCLRSKTISNNRHLASWLRYSPERDTDEEVPPESLVV